MKLPNTHTHQRTDRNHEMSNADRSNQRWELASLGQSIRTLLNSMKFNSTQGDGAQEPIEIQE